MSELSHNVRRRLFTSPTERGAAAVEIALLVPALLLMLALVVAAGRVWLARTSVEAAADVGARAASLARSATEATAAGESAAFQSMETAALRCDERSARVSVRSFSIPVGTPASLTATVGCSVPLKELGLPGAPGAIHLSATSEAALDTYRSRR